MKKLISLMFFSSIFCMEESHIVDFNKVDIISSRPLNIRMISNQQSDEDDIASVILCFHMKSLHNGVGERVQHIVRKKVRQLRESDEVSSSAKLHELEQLKSYINSEKTLKRAKKKILNNTELYEYINSMIGEALEEYAHDKESEIDLHKKKAEEHERKAKVKEKQKWAAIALSAVSIIAGTTTSIIIAYS